MLSLLLISPLAISGSVLLSILGIGFLIFVHELGHYMACRLTKTRVETFSIGFGPRLFGWEHRPNERRRLTVGRRRLDPTDHAMDFRVALVPLGGYVKMAGEVPGEERTGAPDEFPSKSAWARVFIISAGVLMNALTAWVFYLIAFSAHIEQEPAIAGVVQRGGPAWEAGMQPGDRVLSIDGARVRSFLDLKMETVFLSPDEAVPTEVERGGVRQTLQLQPRYDEDTGAILMKILPAMSVEIAQDGKTLAIGAQESATVAGIPVRGGSEAVDLLSRVAAYGGSAGVEIETQAGGAHTVRWTTAAEDEARAPVYKIGIEPDEQPVIRAVRGTWHGDTSAQSMQPGDRIVGAFRGETRLEIHNEGDMMRLPWQAPVDHLEVERGEDRFRVPIPGATTAALYASLRDVALVRSTGLVVRPLSVERSHSLGGGGVLYRYPSVPAAAAGLVAGDRITRVAGTDVKDWNGVVQRIGALTTADPIELAVVGADGSERTLTITPVALEVFDGPTLTAAAYVEPYETDGIFDAAGAAFVRTGRQIRDIFRLIGAFFTGNISFSKNIGGPITIVKASNQAAERSWLQFLTFLAYISITLAVLNILPIPVLDGGHLMFILIEKIKGSPLSEDTIGRMQFIGLMLLLVLMFFAFKNDFMLLAR